jgi:hypothetical protein
MKDFKQLRKDAAENKELAEKLEEAFRQARKSGDKAGFFKAAAELGYEVTEKDFTGNDELVKLDEEQLDDVAGGIWGLGGEAEDGHEVGCFMYWYGLFVSSSCPKSDSGKHNFEYTGSYDDGYYICDCYKCRYCGVEAEVCG